MISSDNFAGLLDSPLGRNFSIVSLLTISAQSCLISTLYCNLKFQIFFLTGARVERTIRYLDEQKSRSSIICFTRRYRRSQTKDVVDGFRMLDDSRIARSDRIMIRVIWALYKVSNQTLTNKNNRRSFWLVGKNYFLLY